ncbi:TrbG/VirB9 family P-type conjugative transfer protein [Sphingobium subterraneum]|uniref:Type IV secretion system protein VirB9 n=1 Tax=Sphingobium subterraneum TaxID=627688 RepID=A0A841J8L2_9SPHN|nr:TrbG/VirB9 family P-type conjugative transfer protein [Sphingobium subterraneum]MBB6124888.1 type IV secretion system protein VirB9 [Sphingobium subterraneum]
MTLRAALLAASFAFAAPSAHAADARVVSRLYIPDQVVRIEGKAGVQASILFAEDEHIENVAVGDSTAWQITPNKRANLLFVKPLATRARTNMTVVTDRHSYFFDLVALPGASPLYALRFTYPDAPKPQTPPLAPLTPAEQAVIGQPVVDPANLNFAWKAKGKQALLPARIYDDGQATYVSWRAGAPVPAILVRDDRGAEGPINYAVHGDMIVIEGVPGVLILRAGRDSATLENTAPRPAPVAADTAAKALAAATRPQEK